MHIVGRDRGCAATEAVEEEITGGEHQLVISGADSRPAAAARGQVVDGGGGREVRAWVMSAAPIEAGMKSIGGTHAGGLTVRGDHGPQLVAVVAARPQNGGAFRRARPFVQG